ncbi:sodium channel subunit beta-3 isoform X3 [Polyodon spathula]|uniref:sodium channel subunit beta-3 isoform X3 n=1 Tax=Polyodon spathula TaxID=7913 RepID=UPI001B7EFD75|nr:sodium channel subunit beta-3 isoform X3 [Polyodon spathula]
MVFTRSPFNSLPLLILTVGSCCSVCVEVPSDNLAVLGTNMKLTCISCMRREEVSAETQVEWLYTSPEGENITMCSYYGGVQGEICPYKDRLLWNGSKDFQDVSVSLINVTMNDTGRYTCRVRRDFNFEIHRHFIIDEKYIDLLVTEEGKAWDHWSKGRRLNSQNQYREGVPHCDDPVACNSGQYSYVLVSSLRAPTIAS